MKLMSFDLIQVTLEVQILFSYILIRRNSEIAKKKHTFSAEDSDSLHLLLGFCRDMCYTGYRVALVDSRQVF